MQETAPITRQPPARAAQTPDPFQPQYRIQALERAAAILGAFTADEPELRLSDLAERLGLHKATTHRFLVNLEHLGFVERAPRSGKYRLGWRLFELGGLVSQRLDLWDEALPFLEGLVRDTGETGHLAVLEGGQVVYIERVETRRALRLPAAARRGHPAHATNLGKVLLAYASPEVVDDILLSGELTAYHAEHHHRYRPAENRARVHQGARLLGRQRGVRRGSEMHRRPRPRQFRPSGCRHRHRRTCHPHHPGPHRRPGSRRHRRRTRALAATGRWARASLGFVRRPSPRHIAVCFTGSITRVASLRPRLGPRSCSVLDKY